MIPRCEIRKFSTVAFYYHRGKRFLATWRNIVCSGILRYGRLLLALPVLHLMVLQNSRGPSPEYQKGGDSAAPMDRACRPVWLLFNSLNILLLFRKDSYDEDALGIFGF